MADIIKPEFEGKKEGFYKDLHLLLELYKLLVQIVETFCSGYLAIPSDELNLHYLRLCNRIEEILKKPGFEHLAQSHWRVFENLRAFDDSPDIDWECGGRQICGNFLSTVEESFISAGDKTYPFSVKDFGLISSIRSYLQQYINFKKNYEAKWLESIEKAGEKYQKQTIKPQVEFPEYDFQFIEDEEIKNLLDKDLKEAKKAFANELHKSTIVLCGGIIETLLIDALYRIKDEAKKSYYQKYIEGKDKEMSEIEYWQLYQLIETAKQHGIVGNNTSKFSHVVRDYRNLIHLYSQKRDKLDANKNTASAVISLMSIAYSDILEWHKKKS